MFVFKTNNSSQKNQNSLRAYSNFTQAYFENCFREYFLVVMRSVAGYVTNKDKKRDRKKTQKS